MRAALLLLLGACAPKELPAHLRIDAPAPAAAAQEARDLPGALTVLLAGDPMGRRADPALLATWPPFEGKLALELWAATAARPDAAPADWDAVESDGAGTVAVGLARGSRLGALQIGLASASVGELPPKLLGWLGPLQLDEAVHPLPATRWLEPRESQVRSSMLWVAERRVLLGWLDSPGIPTEVVRATFDEGLHGQLLLSPPGRLLAAHADGIRDEAAGEEGAALLHGATALALQEVAADRDKEQTAWREVLEAAREESGAKDPIGLQLSTALDLLVADAGSDDSTGLALVALTAERLRNSCPDKPCGGLDRTATLSSATTWSPGAATLARVWQVIALKRAIDLFESSWNHPSFSESTPLLADALLGTGAASMELTLLRQRSAGPSTFLALSRAAGGGDATDLEGARRALRSRLAQVCARALATELPEDARQIIERIERRASP